VPVERELRRARRRALSPTTSSWAGCRRPTLGRPFAPPLCEHRRVERGRAGYFCTIDGLPLTRATLSDNDSAVNGKKVLCHDATVAEVIIASKEHGVPPLHAITLFRSQRKNEEAVV